MSDRTCYCASCGRPLIETLEPEGFDRQTGEREIRAWLSCPRWFRSWRNLWMGGSGHTSFARDNPILGRTWR